MSILLKRNLVKFLLYDMKHNLSTVSYLLTYAEEVCQGKSLRKLTPASIVSQLCLDVFVQKPNNAISIDSYRSLLASLLYSTLAKDNISNTYEFQNDRLEWCFNKLGKDNMLMSMLTKTINASLQSPNLAASLNIDLVLQIGELVLKLAKKLESSFTDCFHEVVEITPEVKDALLTLVNDGFGLYIVVCKDYMLLSRSSRPKVVIAKSCGVPVPAMQTLIDLLKLHLV